MFGFFKNLASQAAGHKQLQHELTRLFAAEGLNFMHLHPEIHKLVLGIAHEEGSKQAFENFYETMEMLHQQNPDASQAELAQHLISFAKSVNVLARK